MARRGEDSAAMGINRCSHTSVSVSENPSAILDCSHSRHIQMLPWSSTVSIPAIVGYIDEDLRAVLRECAYLFAKDGLVADEDADTVAIEFEDLVLVARLHITDIGDELAGE